MGQKQSTPVAPPVDDSTTTVASSLGQKQSAQTSSVLSHNNEERPHNFGQPIRPPHKKAATETEKKSEKSGASKLKTDCRVQQRASLKCIEENYENKDQACAEFFEAYKQCRRDEHQKKLDANAKSSGGGGGFFG
mmetsp:Transcript_7612/g.11048  ORF Transcript_7612/g.11048 Transcript_7612/m.11048 type:complete len:135 (-) Transcript_7612:113-517(-)